MGVPAPSFLPVPPPPTKEYIITEFSTFDDQCNGEGEKPEAVVITVGDRYIRYDTAYTVHHVSEKHIALRNLTTNCLQVLNRFIEPGYKESQATWWFVMARKV